MPTLGAVFRDLRQAVRGLLREKGFTATALLTLALCLGANVVIFTVVRSVLLRPLPFPQPGQLVEVVNSYPKAGVDFAGASIPNYYDRKDAIPAFAEIAVVRAEQCDRRWIGVARPHGVVAGHAVSIPPARSPAGVGPVLHRGGE